MPPRALRAGWGFMHKPRAASYLHPEQCRSLAAPPAPAAAAPAALKPPAVTPQVAHCLSGPAGPAPPSAGWWQPSVSTPAALPPAAMPQLLLSPSSSLLPLQPPPQPPPPALSWASGAMSEGLEGSSADSDSAKSSSL